MRIYRKTMKDYLADLLFVFVALVGASARYIHEWLQSDVFHWKRLFGSVIVGGFAGWTCAKGAQALHLQNEWVWVAAGVGGAQGWDTIEFIAGAVKRKVDKW